MADIKGFKKYSRLLPEKQTVVQRLSHFKEFTEAVDDSFQTRQAARCMDCGIPFCHNGCPLGNIIPDFNDAVFKEEWKLAYEILSSTNNFPEFTGRICPAPCESACVLGINNDPVTIEFIEKTIIEKAYKNGWVKAKKPLRRTQKKVAIIGSGPAGLAASDQLNKAGHLITVFEKNDRIGGLLRYGIPDFKLEKQVVDRKISILKEEGIIFKTNCNVGVDIKAQTLLNDFDAVVLCGGASIARDLPIEGRHYKGVHLAMDYLEQNNRKVAGDFIEAATLINPKGKNIVVIGGGDTGSDCIGTSNRLGAQKITQIELLSKPPAIRVVNNPWPNWPMVLRTSSSQEEGCERDWAVLSKRFVSADGIHLSGIELVSVQWEKGNDGANQLIEIPNSKRIIPCNLAFLAIGFLYPRLDGIINDLGIKLDNRFNVQTENYQTSVDKVFAAGDMRRGQSLVVWAISEGRAAAIAVDEYLTGQKSVLKMNDVSAIVI